MNRFLLDEGISPVVYHFCPLSVMYQISVNDTFILSETGKYGSDARMNSFPTGKYGEDGKPIKKVYPYYMCFSRTPSTLVGYQLMRITSTKNDWINALVRIKLNGNAINNNYKGAPVNFFTEKNPSGELAKKYKYGQDWTNFLAIPSRNGSIGDRISFSKGNLVRREMPKVNPDISKRGRPALLPNGFKEVKVDYKQLERNRLSEYEDRLFSNSPYIKNASRYIEKIDILVSDTTIKQKHVISMISKIIKRYGLDNVFIYDNQIAFNAENIREALSKQEIKNLVYADIEKTIFNDFDSDVDFMLSKSDLYNISGIISMIAFTPDFSEEKYNSNIMDICKMVGLTDFKYYGKKINFFNDIKERCYMFLSKFNDPNIGYTKNFPVYTMYVRNFEKKNQGKENINLLFRKLIDIANSNAASFSRKYCDGQKLSVPKATKIKYLIFLRNND